MHKTMRLDVVVDTHDTFSGQQYLLSDIAASSKYIRL